MWSSKFGLRRLMACLAILAFAMVSPAQAQSEAEDLISEGFEALLNEDYKTAEEIFESLKSSFRFPGTYEHGVALYGLTLIEILGSVEGQADLKELSKKLSKIALSDFDPAATRYLQYLVLMALGEETEAEKVIAQYENAGATWEWPRGSRNILASLGQPAPISSSPPPTPTNTDPGPIVETGSIPSMPDGWSLLVGDVLSVQVRDGGVANLRNAPNGDRIGLLPTGTFVTVVEVDQPDWLKIVFQTQGGGEVQGYLHRSLVRFEEDHSPTRVHTVSGDDPSPDPGPTDEPPMAMDGTEPGERLDEPPVSHLETSIPYNPSGADVGTIPGATNTEEGSVDTAAPVAPDQVAAVDPANPLYSIPPDEDWEPGEYSSIPANEVLRLLGEGHDIQFGDIYEVMSGSSENNLAALRVPKAIAVLEAKRYVVDTIQFKFMQKRQASGCRPSDDVRETYEYVEILESGTFRGVYGYDENGAIQQFEPTLSAGNRLHFVYHCYHEEKSYWVLQLPTDVINQNGLQKGRWAVVIWHDVLIDHHIGRRLTVVDVGSD